MTNRIQFPQLTLCFSKARIAIPDALALRCFHGREYSGIGQILTLAYAVMKGNMCAIRSPIGLSYRAQNTCVRDADDTPLPIFLARHAKILGFPALLCIGLVSTYMICVESR